MVLFRDALRRVVAVARGDVSPDDGPAATDTAVIQTRSLILAVAGIVMTVIATRQPLNVMTSDSVLLRAFAILRVVVAGFRAAATRRLQFGLRPARGETLFEPLHHLVRRYEGVIRRRRFAEAACTVEVRLALLTDFVEN